VPVTRHFIPPARKTTENQTLLAPGVFCDWVSIYQTHGQGLPLINDGAFVRYNGDGEHESTTLKKLRFEGSHETSINIRCDGETVHFEGNVSKFSRQDNVFGFDFPTCISRINAILALAGLPPFTGYKALSFVSGEGHQNRYCGARITRLDLTENFVSGSKENAAHFMRHLASQQASRLKTGTYGEGETVDFGRGSRRVYSKAYLKGPELLRHARKLKDPENCTQRAYDPYLEKLAQWCDLVGLVRFETTYKSTFLIDNKLQYLGGFNMPALLDDFENRKSVFTRANCDVEEVSSLDKNSLSVLRMWQAGDDITTKLKKSAFYKYRSALLPYGVDIAVRSNVIQFQPKTRVITLGPVSPPDFYKLPQLNDLRLAA
jgi:Phage replication protein CRI/Phage X family